MNQKGKGIEMSVQWAVLHRDEKGIGKVFAMGVDRDQVREEAKFRLDAQILMREVSGMPVGNFHREEIRIA